MRVICSYCRSNSYLFYVHFFHEYIILGQYGFIPIECEVSARAVSGVIESKHLLQAEKRVLQYIQNMGHNINNTLGTESSFRGDLEPSDSMLQNLKSAKFSNSKLFSNSNNFAESSNFSESKLLRNSPPKNHYSDPVAMMLANTFRSVDLNNSLDSAVHGRLLMNSKILPKNSDGTYTGVRAIDGLLKSSLPVHPRGPGSGIVFDAGAQWMQTQNSQKNLNSQNFKKNFKEKLTQSKKKVGLGDLSSSGNGSGESVIAGLRIPSRLDNVQSVSFVLTQEAGKLKPKDLKIAIDRNRAEREVRAEEQERLRQQGGGSGTYVHVCMRMCYTMR